jgi:hypothetical protein
MLKKLFWKLTKDSGQVKDSLAELEANKPANRKS